MRLPAGEPGDADVGGRRPGLVVGRHDDQRVAFPVAARLAHVVLERLAQRRTPVHRHDARLVHHLEVEDDVARRLHDADAVVVAIRHHRRRHAARDAAVPRVEVLPVIPGLGSRRAAPSCSSSAPTGACPPPSSPAAGRPAGSTISEVCRCTVVGSVTPDCSAAAEVAFRDGRRMARHRVRTPPPAAAWYSASVKNALLVSQGGGGGTARAAAAAAALERHGADERNRPHPGEIGVAPGRLGVRPALGRLDEMVGLAGRPGLPAGGDDEERGGEAADAARCLRARRVDDIRSILSRTTTGGSV